MKLYFLRHGQSVGNLTENYSTSYHGKLSENGVAQAVALVERLKDYRFDAIIVSPIERAVKTILPYLRTHNRIAEVWSELSEACYQKEREGQVPEDFRYGGFVRLDEEERKYFRIRVENNGERLPPDDENYQEGLRRTSWVYQELLRRYKESGQSVLVVGHGHAGSRLLELFVGMEPVGRIDHSNTGFSLLERMPCGEFMVRFINRES